eukprot:TRINITY_DN5398_c0_g1_i1.p2 TRINITY_DN5398_c0_g1~~TRINITY_DN5398_c0_g1_i1.p2  ORF type:complete len:128 (-),score=22.18 TRINITY_DN5398_c0_g1_i1:158-541(-)
MTTQVLAAIGGASGVSLGAFGAHALKEVLLKRSTTKTWGTAVHYHLIHSAALLGLAALRKQKDAPMLANASACWSAGVLLFSGSLYGLALGGPKLLGPVTPIGGLFLIAGWVCVGCHALSDEAIKED